ncbi:acetyl-CoA carboxylase biotin carboxyl carrier protein [Bacillus licheniformis]|jgi:acetyl-CoA carboxylase biotin carboxyl carrier protein|uniref:Biotin carboxyl carrier protein of acetyl-CoA carboxylase n=6 Tax=Bacillus subtilis group TaxID=653685 RepID=Q65HI4_BACLD|nr:MULTISPECIES: acetyl-CoA carboxylase biotin carboxyl carrier protein [Bacillus]MBJ7883768.1 acetyl-CoA carboxylase biotin carboxyl carrier protein [Bacillaceae bacterium HSR45]MBY8347153.1 acetyl-CoA carboxylase biotin carboxyl carrier protein [Bacillus sp. PCH94]MDP4080372.1 acetyl-CoA carboxylase biotin carboxyl carrier protein [Bacillota bacterium]AAU24121.1 acetyl-CoA carboxylase subunit (biotin carboxyl carrier subunit) [Bacillus licheniformis DSM 13 = ATCC 14580]AAU41480.1 acetyl-CoA 
MLNIDEIRQLIKLIDESSINEFTYENEGSKVELKKQSGTVQTIQQVAAAPVQAPAPEAQAKQAPVQDAPAKEEAAKEGGNFHKITSPMVGTFYASSSPEADPYVTVGSKVTESSVVCIVEAMKLFNEIEAEVKGEIVEVLVENGQLVEYGQPLFLVKAE